MIILFIFYSFLFSSDKQDFCVLECFRTMFSCKSVQNVSKAVQKDPPFHPVHCYTVLVNGNHVIDSRGFYDSGPQQEPADKIELHKCSLVKNYGDSVDDARKDWLNFVKDFDRFEEYSATEMNCCTKCFNSLRTVYPLAALRCEDVNLGIGTKFKITKENFTGTGNDE